MQSRLAHLRWSVRYDTVSLVNLLEETVREIRGRVAHADASAWPSVSPPIPQELLAILDCILAGCYGDASRCLETLVRHRNNPHVGVLHFLRAFCFLLAEDEEHTHQALAEARGACRQDDQEIPARLTRLEYLVQECYAAHQLEDARQLARQAVFGQGKMSPVLARLKHEDLVKSCGDTALYRTFRAFLARHQQGWLWRWLPKRFQRLRRRAKTRAKLVARPYELETFYAFLFLDELRDADRLMAESCRQYPRGEEKLEAILKTAPDFRYAKHLFALCRYRRVWRLLAEGERPAVDDLLQLLAPAREYAREAARDQQISLAGQLLDQICELERRLAKAQLEIRKRQQISNDFEPAIRHYRDFGQTADDRELARWLQEVQDARDKHRQDLAADELNAIDQFIQLIERRRKTEQGEDALR